MSANVQGEIGRTYDAAKDVAASGVLVSQPKVSQDCRFVLLYRVAIHRGVSVCSPQG